MVDVAVLFVQVIPSGEVIDAFPAALETTAVATNKLHPEAQIRLFQVFEVVQVEETQTDPEPKEL